MDWPPPGKIQVAMESTDYPTHTTLASNFGTPARVSVVLFPSFSMMALAATTEPLRAANLLSGKVLYQWQTVSLDSRDLVSSSGFRLLADQYDLVIPESDLVLVIASLDFERLLNPGLLERLSRAMQGSRAIGAVSHGTMVLARAGLLDGYRCTTHWDRLRELQNHFPGVITNREVFCIDRDRWTSSGGTAAMDMMLALIRAQHGQSLAMNVANNFIHRRIRVSGEQQPMEVRWRYGLQDRRMVKAIELMEGSIESPLPLAKIADLVGLSARQLQRLFMSALGRTPEQLFIDIRLQAATDLLTHTDDAIGDIALQCGFGNQSHFARTYLASYGKRPSEVRGGS